MPEHITQIALQAFRGVPERFTLDLSGGRSCVVLGDNGTGKSSIADAIEWYFHGRIDFLAKEGRRDAIRHSGALADLPTQVRVSTTGSLGGSITLDTSSPEGVQQVGSLELFLLRGRTLADFVDKTKGEKWKALAELLGLEDIDQLRRDLQSARNDLEDEAQSTSTSLAQAESSLRERISVVSDDGILDALRRQCESAGVVPPESFEAAVDSHWIDASTPEEHQEQRGGALRTVLADLEAVAGQSTGLDGIDAWNDFVEEERPEVLPLGLYQAADPVLQSPVAETGRCPLCDQPVDTTALATRVRNALSELRTAEQALGAVRRGVQQLQRALRDDNRARGDLLRRAADQGVDLPALAQPPALDASRDNEPPTNIQKAPFTRYLDDLALWDDEALQLLEASIPKPAAEHDRALVELGVLHTMAVAGRHAREKDRAARRAFALADRVFSCYEAHQRDHLNSVIAQISGRAAEIYQFLHPDEEISEVAVETVGSKGAEISVNFHGRKERPPHRVLSESHLNSLGLALFLAMAETFNDELGFLVLDDVVNSFDREHRGRLAELLVKGTPDLQFIVLTHDEQFFTRLSQLAPSWTKEQFTSWSYDRGPRTRRYEDDRLIAEAMDALASEDRMEAAQKGRRALEEFLQEACERLEALLPFRRGYRNDQRMADEVLRGMRRKLREHARDLHREITPLLDAIDGDLQASLNVESHASQGSTSTREVHDALDRIGELRSHFTCGNCSTRVWHTGSPAASRCQCGRSQFPPPPSVQES